MSTVPVEAVFGLLGAMLGAATGAGAAFAWRVNRQHTRTAVDDTVDTETVVHAADAPKRPRGKREILGVWTHYLTTKSPVYPPLLQFSIRLQFEVEQRRFAQVITMIDKLYGMRKSYAGLRDGVGRNPEFVLFAQEAANRIDSELRKIIAFSTHDDVNPSATKRKDMHKFADEIKVTTNNIVEQITRLLANPTVYGR